MGKTDSSISGVGKTGQLQVKSKLDHYVTPHTKRNQNGLKTRKLRPETTQLREENTGNIVSDIIILNNIFTDPSLQAKAFKKQK